MKKLVTGLLVLLVLGAGAFFGKKFWRYLPERPRGAELVPAETIFFLQTPSLRQTALRWLQTDLYKIWQEPEVQTFLKKPRENSPRLRRLLAKLDDLQNLAPGEAFLAVTSVEGPQAPKFVAGFSYAGSRLMADELLKEPRAEFRLQHPAGKPDLASHQGDEIETFTYPEGELAECFHDHWYFLANDAHLLRATLERVRQKPGSLSGNLAGNPTFQKTMGPLGSGLEFVSFAHLKPLAERLGSLMKAAGQPSGAAPGEALGTAEALAFGTRIEGAQLHDTFFVLHPPRPPTGQLTRKTLALGSAKTSLFYAGSTPSVIAFPQLPAALEGFLPALEPAEKALADSGLQWSDVPKAFGPEMALLVEWPEEITVPHVVLAWEARDAAAARKIIEAVLGSTPAGNLWKRRQEGEATLWQAPPAEIALARPAIAFNGKFLLIGMTPEAIEAAFAAAKGVHPPQEALAREVGAVAVRANALGYLDARQVFEHAYEIARPFVTMSLAFSPSAGSSFDLGKLPAAETIGRHLSPSVLSQFPAENGTLVETRGSVTFSQFLAISLGGGVAMALPSLESTLSTLKLGSGLPGVGVPGPNPPPAAPTSATSLPPSPPPTPLKSPAVPGSPSAPAATSPTPSATSPDPAPTPPSTRDSANPEAPDSPRDAAKL